MEKDIDWQILRFAIIMGLVLSLDASDYVNLSNSNSTITGCSLSSNSRVLERESVETNYRRARQSFVVVAQYFTPPICTRHQLPPQRLSYQVSIFGKCHLFLKTLIR